MCRCALSLGSHAVAGAPQRMAHAPQASKKAASEQAELMSLTGDVYDLIAGQLGARQVMRLSETCRDAHRGVDTPELLRELNASHGSLALAVTNGHTRALTALYADGAGLAPGLCKHAARGGHLHVLEWLRAQVPPCKWSWRTCEAAAARGDLAMLQWLRRPQEAAPGGAPHGEHGAPVDSDSQGMAPGSDGELTPDSDSDSDDGAISDSDSDDGAISDSDSERAAQCVPVEGACPWNEFACEAAARGGHLASLEWMRAQDPPCPWGEITCTAVARAGNLEVLQWLRAQSPPCPWSVDAFAAAASAGHLHLVQWMGTKGACPGGRAVCEAAAAGGHLDVLQWLRAQTAPCPWGPETCAAAAAAGRIEVLEWLRGANGGRAGNPCPLGAVACSAAAAAGQLGALRWLRAQTPPCPWNPDVCRAAAERGQLLVLQWLRAQTPPCRWDARACLAAAASGHLATLVWMRAPERAPPCPWGNTKKLRYRTAAVMMFLYVRQSYSPHGMCVVTR
jgi:hypothetical protein